MDERIVALLMLVIVFMAAAGCTGTPSPATTATQTSAPTPEPTVSATTEVTATPAPDAGICRTDDDCVPAQCCHATSCTLKTEAPDCAGVMCSAVCSGPLDCGAGSCACASGKCVIKPASSGSSVAAEIPSFSIDASPARYSPIMSSTPGIKLIPNATGFSTAVATFNWTATNGQFISWDAPDYTIHSLGNPATSKTETVYWTFTERPASTQDPVIITVVATDPASSSVLGEAHLKLTWDGNYAVDVGGNS